MIAVVFINDNFAIKCKSLMRIEKDFKEKTTYTAKSHEHNPTQQLFTNCRQCHSKPLEGEGHEEGKIVQREEIALQYNAKSPRQTII
jgi:hypothetical protein